MDNQVHINAILKSRIHKSINVISSVEIAQPVTLDHQNSENISLMPTSHSGWQTMSTKPMVY